MAITFLFEFDWLNNGTWTNEASEVISAHIRSGLAEGAPLTTVVADVGTCELWLDNSTQRYSPDYTSGPLYGKLVPRRPFRVRATDGVSTWTIFRGTVERIEPESGFNGRRRVAIYMVDGLGLLRGQGISMALQEGKRANQLVAAAINIALGAPAASGTITLTSNTLNGQSVTINGTTYTFKTTLTPAAYEVQIGATSSASAANLKAAINSEGAIGTTYASGTDRIVGLVAAVSSNVITLTSTLPGTIGNGYTLAKSGAGITLSGATLSGGADYPPGLTSLQTSTEAFDVAADRWTANDTDTLEVIRQAVFSDQGRFFVQRDGTFTFYDRAWFFKPLNPVISLNNDPFTLITRQSIDRIYNAIAVTIYPRADAGAIDVLARSTTPIRIAPGTPANPTVRNITLQFRDSSGNLIGGRDVVLPLVPFTDYIFGDHKGGSSYTNYPYIGLGTPTVNASEITIPVISTNSIALYVSNLQVRGRAITTYDPFVQTHEDLAGQAIYQKHPLSLDLPLSGDEIFADSLGNYILDRYAVPFTDVQAIRLQNTATLGGVNVFAVNLFDVVNVTDAQIGLSNVPCFVSGMALDITAEGFALSWHTARADDRTFWNVGVAGFSEADLTMRLAV